MFIRYRTSGIFLEKEDKREADRLFTVYTKDFGKIKVLAKAIRKINSKLRSGTELFYLSEIEFVQGKIYKTLIDVVLIDNFKNIRSDLNKIEIVFQIAELLDKLILEQEKDEQIWNLLNETFYKLNNLSLSSSLLYYYFFWNLISILGYKPNLYNCLVCQNKLEPFDFYLNSEQGGIICENCVRNIKNELDLKKMIRISPDTIKILRLFLNKNWLVLEKLRIEKFCMELLELIFKDYLSYILKNL